MDPEDNALNNAPAVDEGSAPPEPTVEESAAPAVTPEASATSEPAPEPPPKEPTAAERRIAQLVARQRDAERDAAYWRGIAEGRKPVEEATPAPTETGPPHVESFPVYDDYLVAKAKFEMRQELQRDEAAREAVVVKQQRSKVDQEFRTRIEEAAKTDPDILSVLEDRTLPVSTTMAEIIKESEAGPRILRHLSNNRQLAARLAQLTPFVAAKELGKLEAQILSTPKPEPPKKISQAPEPIKPLDAKGNLPVDLAEIPIDDFMKRRNAHQFGKRG
jgi:hypothetical protein